VKLTSFFGLEDLKGISAWSISTWKMVGV